MKTLITITLLTFIIAVVVTMILTGTFRQIIARLKGVDEAAQMSEAVEEEQQKEKGSSPAQGDVDAVKPEEALQIKLAEYKAQIIAEEEKLAAIKAEIESLSDAKESITRSKQLAKIYSSMKPDSAASILCELEEPLTREILSEMSDRSASKIMDAMAEAKPAYAASISKLMFATGKS